MGASLSHSNQLASRMPPGVKPFSKDGAGGWRMELDKDAAVGGHPPHQPAGIEGGDHQAVGPQDVWQPGSAQHGGEYAWQAVGDYPEGWKHYQILVYMCSFDVLLKKLNTIFFQFLNCVFLATCTEFFRILYRKSLWRVKLFSLKIGFDGWVSRYAEC